MGVLKYLKKPLDLLKIEGKLRGHLYPSIVEFIQDIAQLWCLRWNLCDADSLEFFAATELSDYFCWLLQDSKLQALCKAVPSQ